MWIKPMIGRIVEWCEQERMCCYARVDERVLDSRELYEQDREGVEEQPEYYDSIEAHWKRISN
jgi:hypothetical protein